MKFYFGLGDIESKYWILFMHKLPMDSIEHIIYPGVVFK